MIGLGVAAAGTVVPPQLTDFGLYVSLNGQLDGKLNFMGNVSVRSSSLSSSFLVILINKLFFTPTPTGRSRLWANHVVRNWHTGP